MTNTTTMVKDDVFGYIITAKKAITEIKGQSAFRYSFLVQKIGSDEKPQWYNALAMTPKAIAYMDKFTKGVRVGINLVQHKDDTDFNDIKNIHPASKH